MNKKNKLEEYKKRIGISKFDEIYSKIKNIKSKDKSEKYKKLKLELLAYYYSSLSAFSIFDVDLIGKAIASLMTEMEEKQFTYYRYQRDLKYFKTIVDNNKKECIILWNRLYDTKTIKFYYTDQSQLYSYYDSNKKLVCSIKESIKIPRKYKYINEFMSILSKYKCINKISVITDTMINQLMKEFLVDKKRINKISK